ncbi:MULTISPECIES: hypothetical protein [Rummeliibacillus]|jgi:hypothetical protein|uniref:hypothetical protein n=1 Tax=Rummeliibacillus TaxID=648802 RepID=UPI0011B3E61B|nr:MULTISPECIES: hypothetical protein [Rummeliibacillus]
MATSRKFFVSPGNPESKNKIWNYFLTKGQTIFTELTAMTWKVGGQLQTSVNLESHLFKLNRNG